jgi:hypothetical protein
MTVSNRIHVDFTLFTQNIRINNFVKSGVSWEILCIYLIYLPLKVVGGIKFSSPGGNLGLRVLSYGI